MKKYVQNFAIALVFCCVGIPLLRANCEMYPTEDYHTVATYSPAKAESMENWFLAKKSNQSIWVSTVFDAKDTLEKEWSIIHQKLMSVKELRTSTSTCKIGDEVVVMKNGFERLFSYILCKDFKVPEESYVFYDKDAHQLVYPRKMDFVALKEPYNEKVQSLIQKANEQLLGMSFHIGFGDKKADKTKFTIDSLVLHQLGNGSFYSVSYKLAIDPDFVNSATFPDSKLIEKFLFGVTGILSSNGKLWIVADSALLGCSGEFFMANKTKRSVDVGTLTVTAAYDFQNDDVPEIIEMAKGYRYFFNFGIELVVLKYLREN